MICAKGIAPLETWNGHSDQLHPEYPALPLLVNSERPIENGELRGPRGYPLVERPLQETIREDLADIAQELHGIPAHPKTDPVEISSSLSLGHEIFADF